MITYEFIGVFPVVNQSIEAHDATGISIDQDFFGNQRAANPTVGPFENLNQSGENNYQLFEIPGGEVDTTPPAAPNNLRVE